MLFKTTIDKRLNYLIGFRLLLSILMTLLTFLARTGIGREFTITDAIFTPIYTILVLLIASNIVYLLLVKTNISRSLLANIQIFFDILFVSLLTFFSGIDRIYVLLYFIPLVFTPLILNKTSSVFILATAIVSVSTIYLLHYLMSKGVVSINLPAEQLTRIEEKEEQLAATYISTTIAMIFVSVLANALSRELSIERYLRNFLFENAMEAVIIHDERKNIVLKNQRFSNLGLEQGAVDAVIGSVASHDEFTVNGSSFELKRMQLGITPAGNLTAVIIRDVTLLKELERNRQREEMYRSILRISAALAHEIRNPLTSIKGASQELLKSSLDPGGEKMLSLIIKESDKLNNILTDFLKFGSEKPLSLRLCNYQDLVDDSVKLLRLKAKETTVVRTGVSKPVYIKVDSDLMSEALLNLLLNAHESKEKGVLINVDISVTNNRVVTAIADNGSGIPEAARSRIFTPFYTTKPKGTGLGLAIVKKIVDAHNGEIRFTSEPGKGTTFYISLPKT